MNSKQYCSNEGVLNLYIYFCTLGELLFSVLFNFSFKVHNNNNKNKELLV